MAIDNQFRIGELISSGSRAIISKDVVSGNHTFTIGSKEVLTEPYEHIKGERDGELIGRIEKPKYNEEELKKSVDTIVDELITEPRPESPDVVPRPVFEDMRQRFLDVSAELAAEKAITRDLRSQVASLEAQVESLLIQMDALSLQTAAAQNEAQATNDRYTTLLQDFSTAIVKSTKEGIERVSLKAQTEGLIAQKEALRQQLQALNNIVKALRGQIEIQQQQIEAEQVRQAAGEALDGRAGTFDQKAKSGWKLPQSELKRQDRVLYIRTKDDNKVDTLQGTAINLYNFAEEEQTFNLSLDVEARKWLKVPPSITIPPRQGSEAGKGFVTLQWLNKTDDTKGKRNRTFEGNVLVQTSLGETHRIRASYEREVDRKDTWGTRGNTSVNVGQEKT